MSHPTKVEVFGITPQAIQEVCNATGLDVEDVDQVHDAVPEEEDAPGQHLVLLSLL